MNIIPFAAPNAVTRQDDAWERLEALERFNRTLAVLLDEAPEAMPESVKALQALAVKSQAAENAARETAFGCATDACRD